MKKYYLWVIGCQQNEHDGIILSNLLNKIGLIESTKEDADLVVVIACAVRQTAVDRIFGKIRDWGDKQIIVTGCVLDSDKKKFAKRGVPFWDIEDPKSLLKILKIETSQKLDEIIEASKKYSSSVPIMYGCNNFCAYCATPYTRGRERSLDFNKIIQEIKNLIIEGKKEILLLGQNVNSYKIEPSVRKKIIRKNDSYEKMADFSILLHEIDKLEGDFILSFTSNHPKDMTEDIIEAVAMLPKINKEIHLPIQAGSNKILKVMNRPYTREKYLEIINKIRSANSQIRITTDVIVGFPGETEEDFQQTVDIFKIVQYSTAYINKYSPRFGTASFKLGDPIPWSEKQRRWHILSAIVYPKG